RGLGAHLRRRLLVLHPLRGGEGVPHLRPPPRHHGRPRGDPPRRQRAGRGPRLLRRRQLRGQRGRPPHGLRRGHRRPAHLHRPVQGPPDGRDPPRRPLPGHPLDGLGQRRPHPVLRAAGPRDPPHLPDPPPPPRRRPRGRRRRLPGGRPRVRRRRHPLEVRPLPPRRRLPDPLRRVAL